MPSASKTGVLRVRRNLGQMESRETGEVLESFAIVTVEPNEWMAKYHDHSASS